MALPSAQLRSLLERVPGIGQSKHQHQQRGVRNGSSSNGSSNIADVNRVIQAVCGLPSVDVAWALEDDNGHVLCGGATQGAAAAAAANRTAATVARINTDGEYEVSGCGGGRRWWWWW